MSSSRQSAPPPYTPEQQYRGPTPPRPGPYQVPRTGHAQDGPRETYWEATEQTPLNGSAPGRKPRPISKARILLLGAALFMMILLFVRVALPDVESRVRDQRRKAWAFERLEHDNEHAEWDRQRTQHHTAERSMAAERARWDEERVVWAGERAAHEREHEEWQREEAQRARERDEWEKQQHDEDRRARMRLFWESPTHAGSHCHGYGTREYWARLWNVEPGYNATRACERTPIVIHDNVVMQPDWCEDLGSAGGMVGHWLVSFKETGCQPYWGKLFPKDCAWGPGERGLRHIESRLWGVGDGEDARKFCETTPADVFGHQFNHPEFCIEMDGHMLGYWKLPDSSCED